MQDYMVKLEDLNEFINYSHENIECYPLWLCPVRHTIDVYPDEVRELVKDDLTTSIIVDVGIYGYGYITWNAICVEETSINVKKSIFTPVFPFIGPQMLQNMKKK